MIDHDGMGRTTSCGSVQSGSSNSSKNEATSSSSEDDESAMPPALQLALQLYIRACKDSPTYGAICFPLRAKIRGKTRVKQKIVAMSPRQIMNLDPETNEVECAYLIQNIRKWETKGLDSRRRSSSMNDLSKTTTGVLQLYMGDGKTDLTEVIYETDDLKVLNRCVRVLIKCLKESANHRKQKRLSQDVAASALSNRVADLDFTGGDQNGMRHAGSLGSLLAAASSSSMSDLSSAHDSGSAHAAVQAHAGERLAARSVSDTHQQHKPHGSNDSLRSGGSMRSLASLGSMASLGSFASLSSLASTDYRWSSNESLSSSRAASLNDLKPTPSPVTTRRRSSLGKSSYRWSNPDLSADGDGNGNGAGAGPAGEAGAAAAAAAAANQSDEVPRVVRKASRESFHLSLISESDIAAARRVAANY